MNQTGPKVRLSRRIGINLSRRAAKSIERRPGAPGMHRSRFGKKISDYGRQLLEKQRLRFQYNVTERKLGNYYAKALSNKGNTADILIQLLETRLDALTLRAGFAPTIYAARQLVSHGHMLINGRRVNIASCAVGIGDTIAVREKSRSLDLIKNAVDSTESVPYLQVNREQMSATLSRLPTREEIPVICEMSVVVEFYSK